MVAINQRLFELINMRDRIEEEIKWIQDNCPHEDGWIKKTARDEILDCFCEKCYKSWQESAKKKKKKK